MYSIVFFGTYEFAEVVLKALIESGLFSIKLVVTQPDRPVGRHQVKQKPPVKLLAEKYDLPISQPDSLKNFTLSPPDIDLNIVVEYGKMIPESVIQAPKFGTVNIHPSLLPKYRGPSPIQSAILNGETETGISIMLIDDKMDHGPILAQEKIEIKEDETFLELRARLAPLSAELLLKILPLYMSGQLTPRPQAEDQATFCRILSREDGKIDFTKTAEEVYNQYRALVPWPGVFTEWNGKRLKLIKIKKTDRNIAAGKVQVDNGKMFVGCAKNSIEILEICPEGKKTMNITDFLNGYKGINEAFL